MDRFSLCCLVDQFHFRITEFLHREVEVFQGVGSGDLDPDASLALWNDGIGETYDVDSLSEHGVGETRGESGVAEHDGHNGVLPLDYGETAFRHPLTEVADVAFEAVPQFGGLLEEIESRDGGRHDGWGYGIGEKVGTRALA